MGNIHPILWETVYKGSSVCCNSALQWLECALCLLPWTSADCRTTFNLKRDTPRRAPRTPSLGLLAAGTSHLCSKQQKSLEGTCYTTSVPVTVLQQRTQRYIYSKLGLISLVVYGVWITVLAPMRPLLGSDSGPCSPPA